MSNELVDEIRGVEAANESRNHTSVGRAMPTSDGGSEDIESQANIYFQQMFAGQININAMIEMLSRFKESTDKRFFSYLVVFTLHLICYFSGLNICIIMNMQS